MSGNKNKIIAFNYFGGKFTWIEHLYAHFPNYFNHLVDLFAGSFVVSLNYQGKCIKTANEINEDVTNFFQVLRDKPEELLHKLTLTPISNAEYNNCYAQCVMVKFPTKKNNIRSGTVQECIWMNYEPPVKAKQLELI